MPRPTTRPGADRLLPFRSRPLAVKAAACAALSVLALAAGAPATPLALSGASAAAHARLGSRTLESGMNGADVRQLQQLLAKRGFKVRADGRFGPKTRAAVESAQRAYHLTVDGIVGPLTLAALRRGPAPPALPQAPASATGSAPPCASAPGAGTSVTRWRPVVSCVLGLLGQPRTSGYIDDVLIIINYESGGNPNAINLWDSNARAGDPSRGLMQLIGTNFTEYRDPALPDNIYDPAANIYAALRYALARYGTIPNIPGVKSINAGGSYVPYQALSRRKRAWMRTGRRRRRASRTA